MNLTIQAAPSIWRTNGASTSRPSRLASRGRIRAWGVALGGGGATQPRLGASNQAPATSIAIPGRARLASLTRRYARCSLAGIEAQSGRVKSSQQHRLVPQELGLKLADSLISFRRVCPLMSASPKIHNALRHSDRRFAAKAFAPALVMLVIAGALTSVASTAGSGRTSGAISERVEGTSALSSGLGPAYVSSDRHVDSLATSQRVAASGSDRSSSGNTESLTVKGASMPSPYWTNLTNGTTPHARYGAAMAYDPLAGYLLLFGGAYGPYGANSGGSGADLNDTWILVNGSWENITSTAGPAPPPRAFASLTYDRADGFMLLAGGQATKSGSPCDLACFDTWKFSNGLWSPLAASTPQVYGFSAVYDSTAGFVLGITWWLGSSGNPGGGATYGYLGGNWTEIGHNKTTNKTGVSPNFWYPSLVNDPALGGVVMYGGQDWGGAPYSETWVYAAGNWTDLTGNLSLLPPATPYPAASFDNSSQVTVLTDAGTKGVGGTWTFNGTWRNDSQSPEPGGLGAAAFGWDSADNASVQFGGAASGGLANSTNSTWEWSTQPVPVGLRISASPAYPDALVPVNFSATFAGGVSPFTYGWTFGDSASSSAIAPSHAFAFAGTFVVNLTVMDHLGRTLPSSIIIRVASILTVRASGTPNPSDVGLMTTFTGALTGGVPRGLYTWDFGDGVRSSSSSQNMTHSYGASGTYKVHYWANDSGGGSASASFVEVVNPGLVSTVINCSSRNISLGQAIGFNASLSGGTLPYRFAWTFGDGGVGGNLRNITHIFTTNGPFIVSVEVRDGAGAMENASINVSVALNASIIVGSHLGAAPLALAFSVNVTGGVPGYDYLWSFDDGVTSSLQDPAHTFGSPGIYNVSAVVSDHSGKSARVVQTIQVFPGGGALGLKLEASLVNHPVPHEVEYLIQAQPSGGIGQYSLTWSGAPNGCQIEGALVLMCALPSGVGTYAVSATLVDQSQHLVTASVGISGGGSASESNSGINLGWLLGSPLSLGILAIVVASVALAGVIGSIRSRSILSVTPRTHPADIYDSYRTSEVPPATDGSAATSDADPLEDVF
jgi:PKD repeat protein